MFFDPMYFIMLLPALVMAGIATIVTKSTFNKYARVRASSGLTGAEAAERMLTRGTGFAGSKAGPACRAWVIHAQGNAAVNHNRRRTT